MTIRVEAHVANDGRSHAVAIGTNDVRRDLAIPARATGPGSSANGGELLCLALATCYCNDIYREAAARGIAVTRVEVDVHAEFGAPGAAGRSFRYRATVHADADEDAILALMVHTDGVAEVQNTLRLGTEVRFDVGTAVSTRR
jgi:organic hydroperoxide reductase OsmC/OhrA